MRYLFFLLIFGFVIAASKFSESDNHNGWSIGAVVAVMSLFILSIRSFCNEEEKDVEQ